MLYYFFFRKFTVYEITWKDMVEAGQATDDNIILRMRLSCYIT
jgi:hypothetical protein